MNIAERKSSLSAIPNRVVALIGLFLLISLIVIGLDPALRLTNASSGAVCSWNFLATGDWSDASKWSGGVVPGAGDTAVITSGTVTVSADTTVGTLQLGGGTLTCNAALTVSDSMTWTGGTLNGSGKLISNGTLSLSSNQKILDAKLENNGTATWLAGQFTLRSLFDNRAGATFDIQSADQMASDGGTLSNAGTITKSGASTTQLVNLAFTNSGTVNIDAGVLRLAGATTLNNDGSINGAGTLELSGGATLNLNNGFSLTGTLGMGGGTVNVNTATDLATLTLGSGTLAGSGAVTILNSMNWTGGTISGSGNFTIPNGATLNMTGSTQKILTGRTLVNNGTVNWSSGQFTLGSNTLFDNRAGATFDIQSADVQIAGTTGALLNNAGTVTKSGAATTQLANLSFTNSGTVNINAGIFRLLGASVFSSSGSINGSGALEFLNTTAHINGSFNLTGAVTMNQGVTVNVNTTANVTELTMVSGVLSGSGAVTILNSMDWNGGNIERSGTSTIATGATLNMNSASFKSLNSPLTNNGVANYRDTHFFINSTFDNRVGAIFNLLTDFELRGNGTIQNAGTMIKTGGAPSFVFCQLNNSGRLEISSTSLSIVDAVVQPRTVNQTGGVTHLDNGTLIANLAINGGMLDGEGSVLGNVTNSGIISAGFALGDPGTITISKNYTQTASGRLDIELGGANPGINSDLLITNTTTSTTTTLAGTLNISLINGFHPATDATIQIMRYLSHNGAFATTNGLDLGGGQLLSPDYRSSELVLLSGDGGPAVPWVQVIAVPQSIRYGSAGNSLLFQYRLIVGNSGSDSTPVVIVVELPPASPGIPAAHDIIEDTVSNDPLVQIENPADRELFNQIPKRVVKPDGTALIPFVMVLSPHSAVTLQGGFMTTSVASPGGAVALKSWPDLQAAGTGCSFSPEPNVRASGHTLAPSSECISNILSVLLGFLPGSDCLDIVKNLVQQAGVQALTGSNPSLASFMSSLLLDLAKCAGSIIPVTKGIKAALDFIELVSKGNDLYGIYDSCKGSILPNPLAPEFSSEDGTKCVFSQDPNDKVGPDGFGAERFITGSESLRYAVFFENVPTATAPAQTVTITDQLDPTLLNFNTFALGAISFATKSVTPPPDSTSFTTDVDLRPEKNLLVRVNANLNQSTGLLTWSFTSIDPASGQPLPPTSIEGFLNPNVTRPEGEGAVFFVVVPKTGLPTGTVIRNRARIVFDQNAPLDTPEWFNTIDNAKPTSDVLQLAASQCSSFQVNWSGSDSNSAIAHYSVFVSKDGEPFEPWMLYTTQTSEFFNGVAGSTYAFYSIARDGAGNVEDAPAQPDTSITITTSNSISPMDQAFTAQGGDGTVNVLAPGGCNWIAVRKSFFISITTGASGSGNGSVTYHLDPNPTDQPRQGAIVIAGQRFIVNQDAGPASSNRFPIAVDDTATTNQNTPVTIAVLENDSDPDGDTLSVSNVTQASNGSIAINANFTLSYNPGPGFTGTDSFTYTISDGRGGTDTAAVSVTVIQTPPQFKCPQPQGYWKNNPGAWPVNSLTLGSQSYTKTELLNIFNAPAGTGKNADASLILAYQLIAAKLNVANGSDPAPISRSIADADNLLAAFAGRLPLKVKSSSAVGQNMVNTAIFLDSYNKGSLTPVCNP
jgi:hypothetical protein